MWNIHIIFSVLVQLDFLISKIGTSLHKYMKWNFVIIFCHNSSPPSDFKPVDNKPHWRAISGITSATSATAEQSPIQAKNWSQKKIQKKNHKKISQQQLASLEKLKFLYAFEGVRPHKHTRAHAFVHSTYIHTFLYVCVCKR